MTGKQGGKILCMFLAGFTLFLGGCRPTIPANTQPSPVALSPTPIASTATATGTGTSTPLSPTSFETATSIPFIVETPTPIFTPSSGADTYQLKARDEQAALGMVQLAEQFSFADNIPMPFGDNRFNYQADQSVIKLAAQEAVHRFHDSPYREQLEWRITLADTIQDSPTADEWIVNRIETYLNQGEYTLETIYQKLYPYGFVVGPWESAANLFGDGKPAQVFWITRQDNGYTGLYAALEQDAQGKYRVEKIDSTWDFNFGYDEPFKIEEHTGDGIPEIILSPGYQNGSFCGYRLHIYQWQNDHFADLSQDQFSFDTCEYQESWMYVSSARKPVESIETIHDAGLYSRVKQHEQFDWNGSQYQLTRSWLEVPEKLDVHAVEWVVYAMIDEDYPTVVEKLNGFLADKSQVDSLLSDLGPSYPDYLRFQLALVQAYQLNEPEARATLEGIVQKPQDPAILSLSNAARAYLDHYSGEADLYQACQAALKIMDKAFKEKPIDTNTPLGEILKQAWGYQPGLDYPSLSICDLSTAFTHLIARMDPDKFSQAPQFVKDAGVKIRSSKKVDLDGDGQMEWVILIDTPGDDAPIGIWILQHSGEGIQALPLVPWTRRGFDLPKKLSATPAWDVRTIASPEGKTVGFIQAGDYLYAIELNQVDKAIDHLLWGVRDVESYTVQSSGNNLELRVVLTTPDCQHCTEIYPWMDGEFTYIFSGESDPSKVQESEDTLLVDWMPAKAIPLLEEILAKTPTPRLMYLLGLAYELDGNGTNAVKAYWQVWHQFPESAYSRLAQAKLEPKR